MARGRVRHARGCDGARDDRPRPEGAHPVRPSQRLLSAGFLVAGLLHFLRTGTYESIMPGYLPAHRELVLISGVAEIAGGAGVAFASTRRASGVWLIALLVLVFPANVNMAVHPDQFRSIPPALLWARLPLQGVLIWWAYRATRNPRPSPRPAKP